ncbi:MAG TPA: flagellar assembly protein FliH, partial [Pseudolabrys sp.]
MKANAKYLFDEDFSAGGKPTITLVEADRRRADAESQAYRQGFTAGEQQAQADAAQHTATALGLIADAMGRLEQAFGGIAAKMEVEAVDVA